MSMTVSDFSPTSQETQDKTLRKILRIQAAIYGLRGKVTISDTAAHTPASPAPAFIALHALTDCVVSASQDNGVDTLAGKTIKANDTVYGFFTTITLTSGTLIAYQL